MATTHLRCCRNGTPRQPLLVGQARAELRLAPTVPPSALEGLQDFSHCWILYVFHANTDLPRLWDPLPHAATHAKVWRLACIMVTSRSSPL